MAKLHFLLDGNSLGEFALDKERITIGRRPTNQIHIDNLAVSGVHAVIVTIGNDSFLEDLNSTNGTMVNGKNIKKYVLQHDDVIEFGKYQLKYINENQANQPGEAFEKTMIIRPVKQAPPVTLVSSDGKEVPEKGILEKEAPENQALENQASEKIEAEKTNIEKSPYVATDTPVETKVTIKPENDSPTAAHEASGRLQVLNGSSAGRELMLNKTITTLGKPGAQVAVITKRPHGYFITHVGGNNLPTVNGQSIGVKAYALNDRDVVELAGTKMEFHLA